MYHALLTKNVSGSSSHERSPDSRYFVLNDFSGDSMKDGLEFIQLDSVLRGRSRGGYVCHAGQSQSASVWVSSPRSNEFGLEPVEVSVSFSILESFCAVLGKLNNYAPWWSNQPWFPELFKTCKNSLELPMLTSYQVVWG